MQKHRLFSCYLSAFFITWAGIRACRLSTFHPFGFLLFIACLLSGRAFYHWENGLQPPRKYKITSAIISVLFTLFYLCADYEGLLTGLDSLLFRLGCLLICTIGFFLLFYGALMSFFLWSDTHSLFYKEETQPRRLYGRLPLVGFFFCLLCWLPYLLVNYPGVMTVDSLNQYGQIIGQLPMSDHHPWVHTQLIALFYHIGMALTGDAVVGLGLYTIFQMFVMAAVCSNLLGLFVRLRVKLPVCLCVLAFYALLPYNAVYMVTMWKDILFSGMTLLFSTELLRFLLSVSRPSFRITPRDRCLYLISALGMCLLRSNGFYAFLITLPFLFIRFYRTDKSQLPLNLSVLLLVLLIKGPVMNAFCVLPPDFVEPLSIPIQLAARVYADGEAVSAQDNELWNRIVDTSKIPQTYEDFCSDHMKNLIRMGDPDYLEAHRGEYLRLWIRFGLSHPAAYLRAYIDATKGYWFPDIPNVIGSDERIAENPYGLTASPLLRGPVMVKIHEILFKLPDILPVYGLLFSIGAMFWLAVALAGKTLLSDAKRLIVYLPNAAVFATLMLATPVNNEFRYAWPMLLSLPLFLFCAFSPKEQDAQEAGASNI